MVTAERYETIYFTFVFLYIMLYLMSVFNLVCDYSCVSSDNGWSPLHKSAATTILSIEPCGIG